MAAPPAPVQTSRTQKMSNEQFLILFVEILVIGVISTGICGSIQANTFDQNAYPSSILNLKRKLVECVSEPLLSPLLNLINSDQTTDPQKVEIRNQLNAIRSKLYDSADKSDVEQLSETPIVNIFSILTSSNTRSSNPMFSSQSTEYCSLIQQQLKAELTTFKSAITAVLVISVLVSAVGLIGIINYGLKILTKNIKR